MVLGESAIEQSTIPTAHGSGHIGPHNELLTNPGMDPAFDHIVHPIP